jgi:hypothetical protein
MLIGCGFSALGAEKPHPIGSIGTMLPQAKSVALRRQTTQLRFSQLA